MADQVYTFDKGSMQRVAKATQLVLGQSSPVEYYQTPRVTGNRELLLCKAVSEIPKGSSGTVNVYRGTVKGDEAWDGTETRTAFARLGTVPADAWCYVDLVMGGFEIINADACD